MTTETNYEPLRSLETKEQIISDADEFFKNKENDQTELLNLLAESLELQEDINAKEEAKRFPMTRQQRRKIVRDSEIRFAKQKKNFGTWIATRSIEELDLFLTDFQAFLNYPLPKKQMDLLMRGLSASNYQQQKWSNWQLDMLITQYDRKVSKMLKDSQQVN